MGEISQNCFFVLKGKVGVYVFTGDIYDFESVNKISSSNYQLLCTLSEGSHFNMAHLILQKDSIYYYRAEE